MAKEMIFNGDLPEKRKEQLKVTLKYLDAEKIENLQVDFSEQEKYDLTIEVTATQIIVNIKRI